MLIEMIYKTWGKIGKNYASEAKSFLRIADPNMFYNKSWN